MCDTFAPLYPTKAALDLDDLNYPRSWETGWDGAPPAAAATEPTNAAKAAGKSGGRKAAGSKSTSAGTASKGSASKGSASKGAPKGKPGSITLKEANTWS